MTNNVQLTNSISITQWFPKAAGKTVRRDNFLDSIDNLFSRGNRIVIIEGEEGVGKTCLLSQYAEGNSDNVFVLFIGSKCAWDYDAMNLLDDLNRQIYFYLNHDLYDNKNPFELIYFRQTLRNLVYTLKVRRQNITLIIDGIDQIPYASRGNADILIDNLPLTCANMRILISTRNQNNDAIKKISQIVNPSSIVLTGFSRLETKDYFSDDLRLSDEQVEYLHYTFKSPRQLSLIKDKLMSCNNVEACIEAISSDLTNFLEEEWANGDATELEIMIIAILCIDSATTSIIDISGMTNESVCDIKITADNSKYLNYDINSENVFFKFEYYKEFFADILKQEIDSMKQKMLSHFINKNDFTNVRLPTLMLSNGKAEDVILYMTLDNMINILNASNSYAVLLDNIDCALQATDICNKDNDSLKYSLIRSIIKDAGNASALLDEVDALFAINKVEEAINIAQKPYAIEDRLLLLSRVARKLSDNDMTVDSGVSEQIRELSSRIDFRQIKDKSLDIATEIIHFQPDLAIEIIERSSGESTELENELDFAFARLSFERMTSSKHKDDDVFTNLNSKISSKRLRNVSKGLKYLFKDFSASDLIDEVEKLETISEKVHLLKYWLKINQSHRSTAEIIDKIITLINSATDYKPDSSLYYDIVVPIPLIKDKDDIVRLTKWFETHDETIRASSSFIDYVRIKSTTIIAEAKFNDTNTVEKVISLYYFISDISDLVTKTECLSVMLSYYNDYSINIKIEEKEGIKSTLFDDLESCVENIIRNTADHYQSLHKIIKILSPNYYEIVESIIQKMNTQQRKRRSYFDAFDSYIDNIEPHNFDRSLLLNCFDLIKDDEMHALALLNFSEVLAKTNIDNVLLESLWHFSYEKNKDLRVSAIQTRVYSLLIKCNWNPDKFDELWSLMICSLNNIELHTEKIETGFVIVSQLADINRDKCHDLYQKIKELEASIIFKNTDSFRNYTYHLQNAIRTFSGLIHNNLYHQEDVDDIAMLIELIPSSCIQAKMWNELALRFFINGKSEKGSEIVKSHILPVIEDPNLQGQIALFKTMIYLLVSVYNCESLYAYNILSIMPDTYKDEAITKICNYVLYGAMPIDPIDPVNKYSNELSISDYTAIIKLANETSVDFTCYSIITDIIDSVDRHKRRFNKSQIIELHSKLNELIQHKFPTPNCIQHEGFKIISLAQLSRLNRGIDLKGLMNKAKSVVDNTADLVYIYAVLAELTPDIKLRGELSTLAEALIDEIPSVNDRISHLELLGYHLWYKDKAKSKSFFEAAISSTKCTSDDDCIDSQKRLIEIVNRLDDDYAKTLLDMIDDDSSRLAARKAAIKQKESLTLKKSLVNGENINIESKPDKYRSFVNMTWSFKVLPTVKTVF